MKQLSRYQRGGSVKKQIYSTLAVAMVLCGALYAPGSSLLAEQRYYGLEANKLNEELEESLQACGKDRGKMLQISLDQISKQLALMTEFKKSSEESATVLNEGLERAQYYLDWISVEKGPDSAEYKAAKAMYDSKTKEFDSKKSDNDAALVAKAKPPADVYKGADKEKLKTMIKAEWAKTYPDEKIIGIRFPKETWKREVSKEWVGDTLKSYDMSYYYAGVIIKLDDKMAMVYTAVANKDNLSGELSIGVNTKQSFTSYKILLSSLK